MTLSVLSVASEAAPLVKTGGLADVVGALPDALAAHGVEMTTLLPGYPSVMAAVRKGRMIHEWDSLFGVSARLVAGKIAGHPLLVLEAPGFFGRDGNPYTDVTGHDWADNWRRFAALARAAADLAGGAVKRPNGKVPGFDLLHAHDWQAAMAPAFLRFAPPPEGARVPTLVTIHNIAFQGRFDAAIFPQLGLPRGAFAFDGVEYHGGVGYLKAGLEAASAITTVSPAYAAEIRTPEFGMGLEGLIASRGSRVRGILNGIDVAAWNPADDPALAANFTRSTLGRRAANKRSLETEFGLESDSGPLFIVISRLTWQKGVDVLLEVVDHLCTIGGRLAVLGTGDAALEQGFRAAAARHPGRVAVRIGYDEALSHRMQGGGDAILVPSRFEPCGLTQLYGLAYGCVPVVMRTGGLSDTVIDANPAALAAGVATGVQFNGLHAAGLAAALDRTVALYRQPEVWRGLQRNGMKQDFSWSASGRTYAQLYRELLTA